MGCLWKGVSVRKEGREERSVRIEGTYGVRLASDKVGETVGVCGVDETVAYPFGCFYAISSEVKVSGCWEGWNGERYPSGTSATTSNASSTPSSVISAPSSILALYASLSNRRM